LSNFIILRNAITDDRQQVLVESGTTVRETVESSGFVPPGISYSVRDKNGFVVDNDIAISFAGATLSVGLPGDQIVGGGGEPWTYVYEIAAGFVALKFLGPFAEAFASKLGERLGESVAAAASKVRLFRHGDEPRELVVKQGSTETTVIIPENMSDDARLALIDLDVTLDRFHGQTLYWDAGGGAWRARTYVSVRRREFHNEHPLKSGLTKIDKPFSPEKFIFFYQRTRVLNYVPSWMTVSEAFSKGLLVEGATSITFGRTADARGVRAVEIRPGMTLKQAIVASGVIADGNMFNICVIPQGGEESLATDYAGQMIEYFPAHLSQERS
jgi:hypothetical protein